MKILLTADLHAKMPWYDWIAQRAAKFDLICIAGDLLDAFQPESLAAQMVAIARWCEALPTPLAISSGNHDGNDEPLSLDGPLAELESSEDARERLGRFFTAKRWMDTLASDRVVTDGQNRLLNVGKSQLVVTTIPYDYGGRSAEVLWEAGARLRSQHRAPWIVLHHEPPAETVVGGEFGDALLEWSIQEHRPDFLLGGHLHLQPYAGDFADKVGATWCFNAGQPGLEKPPVAEVPNHIILDLEARQATWNAAPIKGTRRIRRVRPAGLDFGSIF